MEAVESLQEQFGKAASHFAKLLAQLRCNVHQLELSCRKVGERMSRGLLRLLLEQRNSDSRQVDVERHEKDIEHSRIVDSIAMGELGNELRRKLDIAMGACLSYKFGIKMYMIKKYLSQ